MMLKAGALCRRGEDHRSYAADREAAWQCMYGSTDPGHGVSARAEVMPRDEFGVPAHIPPELSTEIKHTYYVRAAEPASGDSWWRPMPWGRKWDCGRLETPWTL